MKGVVLFLLCGSLTAHAARPSVDRLPLDLWSAWTIQWNKTYRLGDEWGKIPVTQEQLEDESSAFSRAARRTASFGGGTSFYLGKFNNEHVMATNHHVMETAPECKSKSAKFTKLGITAACDKFLGTWTSVDLTLFTLKGLSDADAKALGEVAENFDYAAELTNGQTLITIGFGIADNPLREMVGNQDSDCVVHSADKAVDGDEFVTQKNSFRFMNDPDELNPGPYKAWSFANGCDVSHGDSGSAMVDRSSGRVVGIIWTARIPKNPKVQKSDFLRQLLKNPTIDIWKELSYAVPAPKIKEQLENAVKTEALDDHAKATIKAVIGL